MSLLRVALAAALALSTLAIGAASASDEVNVYSYRKEELIRPLLDRFTAETGIKVNLVTGNAGELHQRLRSEGRNSPADLLVTVDAGNLIRAKDDGLLQPVSSSVLEEHVPAHLRDPEGYWFGLSKRARVLVYAPDRVSAEELSSYEALTEEKWRGRLLVRSSSNIYNQSLIASMIAAHGVEETEAWARGLVANFARQPSGGDRDQLRSVAAGEGDVAIVNSYYYGLMAASGDAAELAMVDRLAIFFPNQDDRGTHINVSGAGMTAHAPNPDAALLLLEFLVSPAAQQEFAEGNQEYPVRAGIAPSPAVASWGSFTEDTLELSELGRYSSAAAMLADRAGWR